MPLEVECPGCSTRYRVGDDKGGKRLRCKKCQEVITVPMGNRPSDPFAVFDDPVASDADPFGGGGDDGGDMFGNFDMGSAFNDAPTMPPAGPAVKKPKKRKKSPPKSSGVDAGVLLGIGVGALVVIGLGVGAFIFFAGKGFSLGGVDHGGVRVGFGDIGATGTVRVENGSLAAGDGTLEAGEFFDEYTFEGQAGQRISITQWSDKFDTFLMLEMPSGRVITNDDAGGFDFSAIRMPLQETGTYRVIATSLEAAESGSYELEIAQSADVIAHVEQGELGEGDPLGNEGAYEDVIAIQGTRGQRLMVIANSDAFDTIVRLRAPDGTFIENDDACFNTLAGVYSGELSTNSLLVANLPVGGEYQIVVTSYDADVTGAYTLVYDQTDAVDRVEQGNIGFSDSRLDDTGEFYDRHLFQGQRGQKVSISLTSPDFDPYLILFAPSGEQFDCDDFYPGASDAEFVMTLPESGEFEIAVTTYQTGETGNYVLAIDLE